MKFDAIVVGAGPAGATAAYFLAKAGLNVLSLEKKKLPRFKPCGGGISHKFLRSLPFDASPAITGLVSRIKYFYKITDPFKVELGAQLAMLNRQKFDFLIVEEAVRSGAKLCDGIKLAGIDVKENGIAVTTETEKFEAKDLVGADGVFSQIAIWAGLRASRKFDLAREIELAEPKHALDTVYLGFGQVREGYAWSFPKFDGCSVGIGGSHGKELTVELDKWLVFLGYKPSEQKFKISGHPLPLPIIGAKLQKGRVLLAGDAAGLVNPLTGEGIRFALQSGKLAAEAIVSNNIDGYSREIYEKISSDFKYAYYLRALFAVLPGFCYRYGVKNHAASQFLAKVFCGDASFKDFFRRAVRKILLPL